MQKESLYFSTFLVEVDGSLLSNRHLKNVHMPFNIMVSEENFIRKYGITRRKNFICFSIYMGKYLPLSQTVFDKRSNKEIPNKRSPDEAEFDTQIYAVYDIDKEILYLSNMNKKNEIKNILMNNLIDKKYEKIEILNIYKDVEEFIAEISEISKISFARIPDGQANIFQSEEEFDPRWALDASKFYITLNYGRGSKDKIKYWLRRFCQAEKQHKIKGLICKGYDEAKMEKVFRTDCFVERVEVQCPQNDRALYEDAIVFDKLIMKIR